MKEYLKRGGLHDYTFLGIDVTKRGRLYACQLQLTDGTENILIIMSGLKKIQVDVASFQSCILGALRWGYSEFDITPAGNIKLSILCDIQNEMQFEFEQMKFIKQ